MYGYFLKQHNIRKVIIIKILAEERHSQLHMQLLSLTNMSGRHSDSTLVWVKRYVHIIQYKTIPRLLFQHDGDYGD